MTEEEILDEHPGLEKEDFAAVYAFVAEMADMAYGHHDLVGASDPFILDPAVTVRAAIRSAWFVAISDCSAESPVG